jgi:hypothetical protein
MSKREEDLVAQNADLLSQVQNLSHRLNEALAACNRKDDTIETLTMAIRTINALSLKLAVHGA